MLQLPSTSMITAKIKARICSAPPPGLLSGVHTPAEGSLRAMERYETTTSSMLEKKNQHNRVLWRKERVSVATATAAFAKDRRRQFGP